MDQAGRRGKGKTHGGGRGGHEDEAAKVRSALVAQCARGVDQGADAVALQGRADERGAPGGGGGRGLLGAEELFARVGGLGALVGLAKEGREDCRAVRRDRFLRGVGRSG